MKLMKEFDPNDYGVQFTTQAIKMADGNERIINEARKLAQEKCRTCVNESHVIAVLREIRE